MNLKDKLYIGGSIVLGSFTLLGCNDSDNTPKNVPKSSYEINSNKPDYNLGLVVMDDDNKVHSSIIKGNIEEKISLLKDYRKENVSDPSDNTQWKGYVDIDKSMREEYGQLPLRCAIKWNEISTEQMSDKSKIKKLSDYKWLVENTASALDTMRSVKIDPAIQIVDKYASISIPVYDSTSKNISLYRILFGEGGETKPQIDGGGSTKSERMVRLQKINLGMDPNEIARAERTMAGSLINQIDTYLDFANDDFTYGYVIDLLDGKK